MERATSGFSRLSGLGWLVRVGLALGSVSLAAASAGGCSSDDDTAGGASGGASGGSAGASGSSGATGGSAGSATGGSAGFTGDASGLCANCQCSNGLDDDGDGKIDGLDEECTGPNDNDEGSFATGIPGDNRDPKWQDCFFDGNSGAGDDHCRYSTDCLTGDLPATDPNCIVSQECLTFCAGRTPNGCDCFGCCSVMRTDGSTVNILLGPACSIETIDDEAKCPRCTQTQQCGNTCGRCELCPGKDITDIPPDCAPDSGGYVCDNGIPCGPDQPCPNPATQYCNLGCCLARIF